MGTQHIPDQLKKGPTETLRAVFAGIGRMFLALDRTPEHGAHASTEPRTLPAARSRSSIGRHERPHGLAAAQATSRWRSLDKTGNVRLLSAHDLADDYPEFAARTQSEAVDADSDTAVLAHATQHEPVPAEPAAAVHDLSVTASQHKIAVDELPISDYDRSSLASIRARLRGLDAAQVRMLLDYERANAERPDVLGMFERRISKLETGG
jgi:hypothetical protein